MIDVGYGFVLWSPLESEERQILRVIEDATDSAAIFWTRFPDSTSGGFLDVATNTAFTAGLQTVAVPTPTSGDDGTVKVEVSLLDDYTEYFYRFRQGTDTSPTGRVKTTPAPASTQAFRVGWSGDANAFFRPFTVLDPMRHLESQGYEVTWLPVDRRGHVGLAQLAAAITERTVLVSLMAANNETGAVQPVAERAAFDHRAGPMRRVAEALVFGPFPRRMRRRVVQAQIERPGAAPRDDLDRFVRQQIRQIAGAPDRLQVLPQIAPAVALWSTRRRIGGLVGEVI